MIILHFEMEIAESNLERYLVHCRSNNVPLNCVVTLITAPEEQLKSRLTPECANVTW